MVDYRLRYVVYRYKHHSPHSGYSRIAEYGVKYYKGEVIRVDKPLSRKIIRERILRHLAKGTPGYDRAAMAAELKAAWHILRESNYIYHFLYGETNYHHTGHLNNFRGNRLIATFHQPPSGIKRAVQIEWHLRKLSAVVCVGSNQMEYFSQYLEQARIHFVPLGVDTEYYTPPESFSSRDPNLCLFVGENYRDFPTFRGVIDLVTYLRPNTKFIVVTLPQSYDLLGYHPNLEIKSNITEAALTDLYRSASLMVMPLVDSTANNALLESMSCGLPPVVTNIGAIGDYVDNNSGVLVPPSDSRAMAETIIDLLDNPKELEKISMRSREKSLNYSWNRVIEQLGSIYQAVA